MNNPFRRSKSTQLITVFILLVFVLSTSLNIEADYNIREGDTFKFHMDTLKDTSGQSHTFTYGVLIFKENINIKLEFTLVDLPYIRYSLTMNGYTKTFAVLTNIIVQDRNWDDLTIEYEGLGYDVNETDDTWGVRLNDNTSIIVADFLKRDGVLVHFYAQNESQLEQYFGIGEIKINRIIDPPSYYWTLSFLAIIPVGGLTLGLIRYNKKVKLKRSDLNS